MRGSSAGILYAVDVFGSRCSCASCGFLSLHDDATARTARTRPKRHVCCPSVPPPAPRPGRARRIWQAARLGAPPMPATLPSCCALVLLLPSCGARRPSRATNRSTSAAGDATTSSRAAAAAATAAAAMAATSSHEARRHDGAASGAALGAGGARRSGAGEAARRRPHAVGARPSRAHRAGRATLALFSVTVCVE